MPCMKSAVSTEGICKVVLNLKAEVRRIKCENRRRDTEDAVSEGVATTG